MNLAKYNKTIIAVVGASLTWSLATFGSNPEVGKWLSLITAVLTAAGVYQAKNEA